MSIQILPGEPPSALSQMLTGLGTGLGAGLQEGVKQFHEQKRTEKGLESLGLSKDIAKLPTEVQKLVVGAKFQPKLEEERKKNAQTANALADHLNLSGGKRESFVSIFSNIEADKQAGQLKNMMEAQMLQPYIEQPPGLEERPAEEGVPPVTPEAKAQETDIAGFKFAPGEIPEKPKLLPRIGPTETAAKMQQTELRDNRQDIDKFTAPYEDIPKMQLGHNRLEKAKDIIENMDEKKVSNFLRVAFSEKHPEVSELLKDKDYKKLYHLLFDFIRPKEMGGSNPSTREVMMALMRVPGDLHGKDANRFMIDNMLTESNKNLKKARLMEGIKERNPVMDSSKFKKLVNDKMQTLEIETLEPASMRDREGKLRRVENKDVKAALNAGYKMEES